MVYGPCKVGGVKSTCSVVFPFSQEYPVIEESNSASTAVGGSYRCQWRSKAARIHRGIEVKIDRRGHRQLLARWVNSL